MTILRYASCTAALVSLSACFPYFTSYIHLRAPEGTMVPAACGNSVGPPVFARYERQGARFEVTMEPGMAARAQNGFMRVRTPVNVAIAMPDPSAYLSRDNGDPPIRFRLTPGETTHPAGMVEQRFDFDGLPPKIEFGGTLHLPDVIVDGKTVIAPVFEFSRERYAGVLPGNC